MEQVPLLTKQSNEASFAKDEVISDETESASNEFVSSSGHSLPLHQRYSGNGFDDNARAQCDGTRAKYGSAGAKCVSTGADYGGPTGVFRRLLGKWRGVLLSLIAALIYTSKSIVIRLDHQLDFILVSFVAVVIQGGVMGAACLYKR